MGILEWLSYSQPVDPTDFVSQGSPSFPRMRRGTEKLREGFFLWFRLRTGGAVTVLTPESQQEDKEPTWGPGWALLHQKPGATVSSKSVDQKMKSDILRSTV